MFRTKAPTNGKFNVFISSPIQVAGIAIGYDRILEGVTMEYHKVKRVILKVYCVLLQPWFEI